MASDFLITSTSPGSTFVYASSISSLVTLIVPAVIFALSYFFVYSNNASSLEVLEEICPLSARVVVNEVSMKMQHERITKLIHDLKQVIPNPVIFFCIFK